MCTEWRCHSPQKKKEKKRRRTVLPERSVKCMRLQNWITVLVNQNGSAFYEGKVMICVLVRICVFACLFDCLCREPTEGEGQEDLVAKATEDFFAMLEAEKKAH